MFSIAALHHRLIIGVSRIASLSDNARLPQNMFLNCDTPGRGDGIGRRSGLKHRRRKAWGFDFPPRHQEPASRSGQQTQFGRLQWLCSGLHLGFSASFAP